MDLMGLMGMGIDTFDPETMGVDGAKVLAINEMANRMKDHLDSLEVPEWLKRLYPGLPLVGAFVLHFLTSGMRLDMSMLKEVLLYGVYAITVWNVYKKTFKGE